MDFRGKLYNIMPIANMASVLKYGILSNSSVKNQISNSKSVAMKVIQEKRGAIRIPNGLLLHDYANLYFDPSNPMMYKLKSFNKQQDVCVLEISESVLELDDVVLSDQNASSSYARFLTADQIDQIDFDKVYARDWRHPGNVYSFFEHKSKKCAEVLVPYVIPPEFILAAHVVNDHAKEVLLKMGFAHNIMVTPDIFFC